MLKRPMERINGQNLNNFLDDHEKEKIAKLFAKAQKKPSKDRIVFNASDSIALPAMVSVSLLEQAETKTFCIVASDLSELEKSQKEIEQIYEQKITLEEEQTELVKINRILHALSDTSQAMMKAQNEEDLLNEICEIVHKDCGYKFVLVNYVEHNAEKTVRPVASAGIKKTFLKTFKISWGENKYGNGPTGSAIKSRQSIIYNNLWKQPVVEVGPGIIEKGIVSMAAIPLGDHDVFGTLNVYSNTVHAFSEDEVNLLKELANDISFGVISLRLRKERDNAQEELRKTGEKLKHVNREFYRSNTELEIFANVISHDLREPLRAVAGFIELLKMKYSDKLDETAIGYIDFALDGAKNMRNMILGLLEYSRVQFKGGEFAPVDANDSLNEALNSLHASITENNAEITYEKLPTVYADGPQFARLLQNLIHNAVKFRKDNEIPKINISCKKDNGYWRFSISDNGIGIGEDFKKRLFTIFQREHRTDRLGEGVGLAVCKRIVERHGGKIWAESEESKGTTVYFTIPISP